MVTYALDVDSTRVANAMEELGIAKEELIIKTYEDFAGQNISNQIQKIRFEYYSKMLKNTVAEVKGTLKRQFTNIHLDTKPNVMSSVKEASASQKNLSHQLDRFTFKQRSILLSTLSSLDLPATKAKQIKSNRSAENFKGFHTEKNYKEVFKKCKDLQSKNLKVLKKEQMESQLNLFSKLSDSMKEHSYRERMIEERKRMLAKEKDDIYTKKHEEIVAKKMRQEQAMEDDIAVKLQKFDNKISRSEELHSELLKEKVDKTLKLREVSEIVHRNQLVLKKTNEVEQLQKLIDKQQSVNSARSRISNQIHKTAMDKKQLFDKRHNKALEQMKKTDQDFSSLTKIAERKLLNSQQLVRDRKQKLNQELEVKREFQRLHEYECLLKVQRAKRKFVIFTQDSKMNKRLQHQLEKYHKIDEFKSSREKEIYSTRESAIKAMIEREKLQEAVALIWKSPRSKTAQEKLKSLNLYSKDASITEAED